MSLFIHMESDAELNFNTFLRNFTIMLRVATLALPKTYHVFLWGEKTNNFVFFPFEAEHRVCHIQSREGVKVMELKSSWALRREGNPIQAVS